MALRLRRGTDADRLTITPEAGEPIYATDTKLFYMGDGTTAGGRLVAGTLEDDPSPALGANLDLNGNNITGTGNINIDGTITATGNINLGDDAGDNINVGGEFVSNLTPNADSTYNLGSASARWNNIFATGMQIDGQINAVALNGSLIGDDSTVAFNAATGTILATSLTADDAIINDLTVGTDSTDGSILAKSTSTSVVGFGLESYVDGSASVTPIEIRRYKGTPGAPTAVTSNDQLGILRFKGYDGTSDIVSGFISHTVSDSVAVSSGVVPGRLSLGVQDTTGSQTSLLQLEDTDIKFLGDTLHRNSQAYIQSASSTSTSKASYYQRARGTIPIPTAVQSGDQLYTLNFQGHDGSDYVTAARIRAEASGSGASGVVAGRIRFLLSDADGNITTFLRLEGDEKLANFTVPLDITAGATIGTVSIAQNNITTTDSNANLRIAPSGTGTLQLDVPTQSTVGSAGGADAVPANPTTYIKINVDGTDYVIPAFAVS